MVFASCTGSKVVTLATQGKTSEETFNQEIPFNYLGKHIILEVAINKKNYAFMLDTGLDITLIDNSLYNVIKFLPIQRKNISGSTIGKNKTQFGTIAYPIAIGNIDFQNTGVGLMDLSFIKSPFPDKRKIHGVIGTNILRKASWQIDYQKQVIKFSDKIENFLPSVNAHKMAMLSKGSGNWGLNRIQLTINGVTDNFVFDTGSYGNFSANSSFLERLEKTGMSLKVLPESAEKDRRIFNIDILKLNNIHFENQELGIEEGISLLIGNGFLENFLVTIDWKNNILFLSPKKKT